VYEIINVTDRDSFNTARRLCREEAIFCGGSTGTNAWAALKIAESANENDVIVFIVCDTGERYLSKYLSDEWLKEKQLIGPERMTLSLLNESKLHTGKPRLISITSGTLIGEALKLMNERGLSQLPVIDDGKAVGSVRENRLMAKLLDDRQLLNEPVKTVMDEAFPVVNEDVAVERAMRYLKTSPAILVEEYGRIVGIITRHDVIDIDNRSTMDGRTWPMFDH
jgi:cystathionine beta-synthase